MHTILVPVDGSSHSLKALQIACDLAGKYGGRIALLHVLMERARAADILDLTVANSFTPKMAADLKKVVKTEHNPPSERLLEEVGQKVLDDAVARVQRRDIEVKPLALHSGEPARCILAACKRTSANTIVMGSRGVDGANPSSFGSVSRTVFAEATCTCISVK